ncbi:MAG: inositol monophosphatase family protein [Lawsonibacter sp.]|nr:inositol monophosphatase family protein [Lawsonibacter sp.]
MEFSEETLFTQLSQAVREAGRMFSDREKAAQVKQKGATDFVTQVDVSVQDFLKVRLAQLAPEVQLMGEEKDNSDLDYTRPMWVLDPVDGTTNLVHSFCCSAVSLALVDQGDVLLGLVYNPFADELFTARKGMGACLNGMPIQVSAAEYLADSLVNMGTNPGDRVGADRAFRWMRGVYNRCHDVRQLGVASVCLCYVAAGRLDGYVEGSLKPWDYAAGMLIVREAGGVVRTTEGSEPSLAVGSGILGANGQIGPELLDVLRKSEQA